MFDPGFSFLPDQVRAGCLVGGEVTHLDKVSMTNDCHLPQETVAEHGHKQFLSPQECSAGELGRALKPHLSPSMSNGCPKYCMDAGTYSKPEEVP